MFTAIDELKLQDGKKGKQNKSEKKNKKENRRQPAIAKRSQQPTVIVNNTNDNDDDNPTDEVIHHVEDETHQMETEEESAAEETTTPPEINPHQSLFDNHISSSLAANVSYMTSTYSFYLPDPEYLIDLEGLLGYCSEKVRLGHTCLYCQRMFTSYEGCMKHMRDKRHCKILYERGVDQEEFDVFYDFEEANQSFLGVGAAATTSNANTASNETIDEEEDGEWEDVDEDNDDEEMEQNNEEDDDDDMYAAYQEEIASHGFDITPLGELIFPDGRIIGHRGLSRYYKQRFAPDRMERAAVRAARIAAGDRMYNGRVVNMYRLRGESMPGEEHGNGGEAGISLATAGSKTFGCIPRGREGKGILVNAGGGFTSLSLYRYRAAVKKQRREDDKGKRLQYRTQQNMNKMGKKGNILSTGFSTSHAPR